MKVWCDDASHRNKRPRVFVAEFEKDGFLWQPQEQTRAVSGLRWWHDDNGTIVQAPDAGQWGLLHHTMTCRICKARPLTVRVGKLDAIFDLVAEAGRGDVTLSEVRAILETSRR
jgi:hypothetical protein